MYRCNRASLSQRHESRMTGADIVLNDTRERFKGGSAALTYDEGIAADYL
jgi:hypothetical protein